MRWSSLNLLSKPLPVMLYLHGVIGPCGSSLTIASRRIGPRVLKNNLAKTPTWTPSTGPGYGSGYPSGFATG